MLFERFVFVLYLLFHNALFLWWMPSSWCVVPLVMMVVTLLSVILVTLFQLQMMIRRASMPLEDRWATVAWSLVHICLSLIFLADTWEWADILVTMTLASILLTAAITTVAICACYVSMRNSSAWMAHVHFVCICMWVFVHFLTVRLPEVDSPLPSFVTCVPLIAMAAMRLAEHVEWGVDRWAALEGLAWVLAIVMQVLLDVDVISSSVFYALVVCLVLALVVVTRQCKTMAGLMGLPFMMIVLGVFWVRERCQGRQQKEVWQRAIEWYDAWMGEPLVTLPFEDSEDEDWHAEPL